MSDVDRSPLPITADGLHRRFSWLAMTVMYESDHTLHACLSGGIVSKKALHSQAFSRTDLAVIPHALFVAWGSTLWACLIPIPIQA
jgi:hypothetical protein